MLIIVAKKGNSLGFEFGVRPKRAGGRTDSQSIVGAVLQVTQGDFERNLVSRDKTTSFCHRGVVASICLAFLHVSPGHRFVSPIDPRDGSNSTLLKEIFSLV